MPSDPTPLDDDGRAAMKRWLENWRRVGPILERERWERLAAMTAEDNQRVSEQLLDLWRPEWRSDEGEELLLHQRVFARARMSQ
jgi:hypothetical protein